jgi:hypothetical protein
MYAINSFFKKGGIMIENNDIILKELQLIRKNLDDISIALLALAMKDEFRLAFDKDNKLALYSKR